VPEPLVGAPLIARFMAALAQVTSGELDSRPATVNGQPGRVVRGPVERPLDERERVAGRETYERLRSGDLDAQRLAALVRDAREATRQEVERRVVGVLTVDVVGGRIQAVRIVRNPDKLAHL
jgi:RNA polymerase sigma-70 factor (ECF subfamily)